MVAAGVQTIEIDQQRQEMIESAERILEEANQVKKKEPKKTKVEIDLPRVDSQEVVLSEVKKLKLELDKGLRFSIDGTIVVDCPKLSPGILALREEKKGGSGFQAQDEAFKPCLKALGEKLVDNDRIKKDKELYLLADRSLDYGIVLKAMAVIRQAGVTKFGLVAEPALLEGAETAPTPEEIK
jgi:biopolymer transport protein ExbD